MEKRFASENLDDEKQAIAQHMNLEEENVPAWTVPHAESATVDEFLRIERPRLLEQFARYMYGVIPPRPASMDFDVVEEDATAFGGLATRREISIRCAQKGIARTLNMLLYIPNQRDGKVPVFFGLNFKGNHAATTDPNARFYLAKRYPTLHHSPRFTDGRVGVDQRGLQAYRFCFEDCLKRGYAVATICYWDIYPDHPYGFEDSIFPMYFDKALWESPERPSAAISAWAWGVSRALDVLESQPEIDRFKMMVHGHSRLGKTALWAGANDDRIALAISSSSGTCGAKLSHRYYGEDFAWINLWNPHWVVPGFLPFINRDDQIPVDQNQLIGCIAPRFAYVSSATQDVYADPKGEFLATVHASSFYNLFGMEGQTATELPEAGHGWDGSVGYYLREGDHECMPENWAAYLDFADRHILHR